MGDYADGERMEIEFGSRKLAKQLNDDREMIRAFGKPLARHIKNRLALLGHAKSLDQVPHTPPERRHQLRGDRARQWGIDLGHQWRMVLESGVAPVPQRPDGGIALEKITAVRIVEIVDYHTK